MRRTILLASMAAIFLASSAVLALNAVRCQGGECLGTPGADEMVGTDRPDDLSGSGCNDAPSGGAGGARKV